MLGTVIVLVVAPNKCHEIVASGRTLL